KIDNKINNLIKNYFSNRVAKKKAPGFEKFSETQNKKRISIRYQDTEQVHIALGFLGYKYLHPDLPAEVLLSVILGGNMSSRLFIDIREQKGLAYFIKADTATYEDTGGFIIQAGIDKKRIYEAIKAILDELEKIKKYGVKKEELKKAQDYLAGRVALDLEDSSSLGSWYGQQELLEENLISPEEKLKQYRKITSDDIKRVANKIFQNNKINLSVIGPFKDKTKFNKILKIK
ncbi:MAG: pitrilysin family protein, partial [Patescibacteria group bacterium]